MKKNGWIFFLLIASTISNMLLAQEQFVLTPERLQFPREKMQFDDKQVLLFNGRGFVSPREYGMTSFTNVHLFPVQLFGYEFFINIFDEATGTLIRDDVATEWQKWTREQIGWDPLGANFRPYAPMVMVTQDEVWQPNLYTRTGTFHKEFNGKWVTFSMNTAICVSGKADEVLLKVKIHNRNSEKLDLTLIPNQQAPSLPCHGENGSPEIKVNTPFKIASEQMQVVVESDITNQTEKGYNVSIPPQQSQELHFAIRFIPASQSEVTLSLPAIKERFEDAQQQIRKTLKWASEKIPSIKTENTLIDDFFYRSMLSVLMCRYERDNFIIKPFWAVGTWPFTISWDNSFTSDLLAMLEPNSLKETLRLNFEEGKMKRTYIGWAGASWDLLYIQEPFAQQIMIEAYMNQTGDISILSEKAGDATIYEWMKRWAYELHDNYGRKDGLIDVGYSTEKIIEIRTDGYNHVVPIVNGLTVDLYRKLAYWAVMLKDKEAATFTRWADQLRKSMDEKLWNEEKGWYDNLYPDGSKATIWTYHLFDLLGSPSIDDHKRIRLMSHIKEEVFLGEFGFYSIARNDSIHWDRIDGDWGGGGQYAGMPTRIARNLYKVGNSTLGWQVLKRFAGYVNYFPYLTQNASTDKPHQDMSSMPLQIAAGAGVEVILFGIFGLEPSVDGTLRISPVYHSELGHAVMKDYHFRGNTYDVEMLPKKFKVLKNGRIVTELPYGEVYMDKI